MVYSDCVVVVVGGRVVVVGRSLPPPLPGWVLSRLPPVDLQAAQPTASRRRWWHKLLAG